MKITVLFLLTLFLCMEIVRPIKHRLEVREVVAEPEPEPDTKASSDSFEAQACFVTILVASLVANVMTH